MSETQPARTAGEAAESPIDDAAADEVAALLIEEVSIDGMCGVY
jgi:mycofactocin precursor